MFSKKHTYTIALTILKCMNKFQKNAEGSVHVRWCISLEFEQMLLYICKFTRNVKIYFCYLKKYIILTGGYFFPLKSPWRFFFDVFAVQNFCLPTFNNWSSFHALKMIRPEVKTQVKLLHFFIVIKIYLHPKYVSIFK